MISRKITIGTRGSALALKQTDIAIEAIKSVDPSITIDVRVIRTHGDVNQNPIPLDTIGKGWFTEEIENALLNKEIDIAVHSLKDMADKMPVGLCIGAYLPREDARDVLITKHGEKLEELPLGAIIGTDSARRQVQMLALKSGVRMKSLRGNVVTRLEKLSSDNYDAIILASAGLKRLGLEKKITRYFGPTEMVPAPGQGTLAIQARENDATLQDILTRINDSDTARITKVERSFSHTVGGGCKAPTGAYATRDGDNCTLLAMIVAENGRILHKQRSAAWEDCEELGVSLAKELLSARL